MDNQQTNGIIGDNNQLTMPKVLDYLQNEWLKFEVDRSHWISEKAELNNRILKLESEKKLNYSHNYDLCRRVKMLEYALHQERLKNEALLKNTAIPTATTYKDNDTTTTTENIPITREPPKKSKDNTTRLIIRKYLREMGYDDIIVSKSLQNEFEDDGNNSHDYNDNNSKENTINSNNEPVKTILSLKDIKNNNPITTTTTTTTTSTSPQSTSPPTSNIKILNNINNNTTTIDENTKNTLNELVTNGTTDLTQSLDSLSTSSYEFDSDSLLDNLKQLDNSSVSSNSNSNSINSSSDSLDTSSTTTTTTTTSSDSNVTISTQQQQQTNKESEEQSFNSFNEDIFNKLTANSKGRMKIKGLGNLKNFKKESNSGNIDENGNDFTFPPDQNSKEETKSSSSSSSSSGSTRKKKSSSSGSHSNSTILSNNELMGLGASDLNDITLDDGSKTGNDSAAPRVWKFKHSLKSHFDGVRSIQFHPNEPLMISSSEDHSIKIWNLNHLVPTKKSPSPEIEPIYTIRGHIGPVFTTEWNQINGELSNYTSFFSAGYDMIIRQWSLPSSDIDPYYQHGKVVPFLEKEFVGHHDGIWDLLSIPNSNNLLSASSDGTISLWDTNTTSQLVNFIPNKSQSQIPTSITLPATENNRKLLAAYNDGSILLFDLETQQIINQLKQSNNGGNGGTDQQINKIVSHPFMPLAITGSEDHKIEFFDLNSKSIVHSMIAHSNSISSLTIDPSGLYIASCSHDSSIRFWEVGSKTCIQDLNSHRPKYDESIHCIKYHPNKGYFASGGADSVIRIHQ